MKNVRMVSMLLFIIMAFVVGPAFGMIYSSDMMWADWSSAVTKIANTSNPNNISSIISQGKAIYDKWSALTYGLSDAQIAALPQFAGKTVADITAMRYAVGVFKTLSDSLDAQKAYLVPFE